MQRRITAGSSLAETTTIGRLGYCARRYIRPEKPRTPGHAQIEQDQIDIAAAAFEKLADLLERAGFGDLGAVEYAGDRFAQCAAEQRMIVGDHTDDRTEARSTG